MSAEEGVILFFAALLLWRLRIVRFATALVLRPFMIFGSLAVLAPLIFFAFLFLSAQG